MNHRHLSALCARYGWPVPDTIPNHWTGATSRVYPLGDVVIKVALDTLHASRSIAIDAAMNPVARDLGIMVPEMLAFDDSCDIMPVPYAVIRRVPDAIPLADLSPEHPGGRSAWEAVGRDLARLHEVPHGTPMPVALREFRQSPDVDPRPWVHDLETQGSLDPDDAGWLRRLLDALAPAALADVPLRLCHGDTNGENILVDAVSGEYLALIDWAGAGWLDPAWSFVGVPLANVPWMLEGHRSVASLPHDETAEARLLWCQLQTRLLNATMMHVAPARDRIADDLVSVRAFAAEYGFPSS